MKRIVLTYGLIAGAILAAVMLAVTIPFHGRMSNETGMIVGYTSMVAASLLIWAAIRRYRDTVGGGTISFGRALAIGALITCVSGAVYTATWEVMYFGGATGDFLASYQEQELAKARARGATEAELAAKQAEMEKFAKMYENPAFNAALTFAEPLPVGLLVSLVAAAVLRRRRPSPDARALAGLPTT